MFLTVPDLKSTQVTYHQLGLLHAVIAVPWMFQIGFVQALPLLVEQMIQQGFWEGFLYFVTQLPFGLVFFVFHVSIFSFFLLFFLFFLTLHLASYQSVFLRARVIRREGWL